MSTDLETYYYNQKEERNPIYNARSISFENVWKEGIDIQKR
jgi:hypothetical protein